MNPLIGTLTKGDVYPGLATKEDPAPNQETTDEKTSAKGLEGAPMGAKALRPSMWFIGFAVLLVVLYLAHGE